jgi:predicted transcriptional regulator
VLEGITMESTSEDRLTQQTVDVVSAYVANNNVRTEDLANLINTVRAALSNSGATAAAPEKPQAPMSWKKAIKPDGIVSFEDGKSYKSMKRHLTRHGLTPQQYREKWGLPKDFPMVAPNYAAARSELARKLGLGTKGQAARKSKGGAKKGASKKAAA